MKNISKLASKIAATRTGHAAPRTGQTMMAPGTVAGNGTCGPAQATQLQSWGAGCPPGHCTSDQLAANLNRAFAGERYGCRELPYSLSGVADAGGVVTLTQNSLLTICPTRIEVLSDAADGDFDATLTTFTVGSQNQIIGDPIPIRFLHPESYQVIPFVTDCIKSGQPFSLIFAGATVDSTIYVTLIGPAIG